MPVVDRKPIGGDYDDEHHSRLIDRQHKNNNDASPIFASIPHRVSSSSPVRRRGTMVPWENCGDRRPQPPQLIIYNTTHNNWQKDHMKKDDISSQHQL